MIGWSRVEPREHKIKASTVGFDNFDDVFTFFIAAGIAPSLMELVSCCLHSVKSDGFGRHPTSSL